MGRLFLSHLVPSAASGLFLALAAATLVFGGALSVAMMFSPPESGDAVETSLAMFGMLTMPGVAFFVFLAGVVGKNSLSRAAIFGTGSAALLFGGLVFGIAMALGTDAGTAIFGTACFFTLPMAFTVGPAIWFGVKAGPELREAKAVFALQRALELVEARGKIAISELAKDLEANEDEVNTWLHDAIERGKFTGYANWKTGMLYSSDASAMQAARQCPGCGAALDLAGKGVVLCDYCGTELFLRGGSGA